jgi:Ca-activated chloride channel homolog
MRPNRILSCAILLAFSCVLVGMPSKAGIALKTQEQDASTYYKQGVALFKEGNFKEAIKALKQVIKLQPDYVDAHNLLGEMFSEIRDFDKAVDSYKQAAKYQPNSPVTHVKLGGAYYAKGDYNKAVEAYNEALRLDPKAADVHYKLGVIHAQRQKEQAAVGEYNILQSLDPKLAQELYNLIYKPLVPVVSNGAVRFSVIAMDRHGAPVNGLTTEDFQVLEGDLAQSFTISSNSAAPTVIGIAIDTSGSVRPVFNLVIASAKYIVERALAQDETFLLRFISSDKIETVQEFTSDKKTVAKAIDTLYIEGGQSAVVDAVYLCAERVAGYKFPDPSINRVLLLLSDGEDRASYYSFEQLAKLLRRINVQVFAISFSADANGRNLNQSPPKTSMEFLRKLAFETGGKAFFPKSVPELQSTIDQISLLVHGQHTIEYKPTKPVEAGLYRPLTVKIVPKPDREHWSLAVRRGYLFSAK